MPRPESLGAVMQRLDALERAQQQTDRACAALVDMASPDGFRRSLAATTARTALASLSALVETKTLVLAQTVSPGSVAVQVREVRGDEVVTPRLVLELARIDADSQAAFMGKAVGDRVQPKPGEAFAVVEQVWDKAPEVARREKVRRLTNRGRR